MPRAIGATRTLQQETFAARLTEAFAEARKWGVEQKAVAQELGWSETTLSRYKDPKYPKGPPRERRRRQLEGAIGIPSGYLDRPTGDLTLLRKGDAGHSRMGESVVTYPTGAVRGLAKKTAVGTWKAVAQSVAAAWHSIIVHRKIPHITLLELLRAEVDWLKEKHRTTGYDGLLDAAEDVERLIESIRFIQPR